MSYGLKAAQSHVEMHLFYDFFHITVTLFSVPTWAVDVFGKVSLGNNKGYKNEHMSVDPW